MATENLLFIGGIKDGQRHQVETTDHTITFLENLKPASVNTSESEACPQQIVSFKTIIYRRFWITRSLSVFVEMSIDGDEVLGRLIENYTSSGLSIVQENMLARKDYTPYCGADRCGAGMPRTTFDGEQFACRCGWRSSMDRAFIEKYIEFNRPCQEVR